MTEDQQFQSSLSRRRMLAAIAAVTVGTGVKLGLDLGNPSAASAATRLGLDFNTYPNPSPSTIRADGYTFVCQYLAGPGALTRSSALAFIGAGIDVVCNWEMAQYAPLNGYSQGVSDAQKAQSAASAAGMPAARPIYFSLDWDVQSGDLPAIEKYFDGIASVIGRDCTGAYGGYYAIQQLFNSSKIKWGWQTYAWSGGNWDSRSQLRQIKNDIQVGGTGVDEDQAVADDFGQWGVSAPVSTGNGITSDSSWSVYNPDTKTMTLFGLGSGGHLGLTKSTNGGASWSNWAEANAYWRLQGTPNAVYDADAKMTMLFARGQADGAMGISTSTNNGATWSNWAQVNAYWSNFKGDASAVYNPDTKKVTVFARGGDGRIGYTQSGNAGASWSNWAEVNAYWNNFAGDPHVIYNPYTKKMTVFARGGDGRIGYTQSGNDGASWSNWAEVNAYWNNFAGDPHVVLNPDTKRMTVFARGGDGRIGYTQSGNDGASWSNWAEVNAYWNNFAGDPRPVYNASAKTISLLARGGDGRIGYSQSGNDGASWSNWAEANAYWNNFVGDPSAIYDPDTAQSTVFALGSGGHMGYTQSINSVSGWTNWAEVNAYWTLIGS
ncbi:glycoside hydrolase domain-containing protein [Streptomyces fodineus]|nr:glycoside hydrolase domain-containing protein [Streptomyces fodineus]